MKENQKEVWLTPVFMEDKRLSFADLGILGILYRHTELFGRYHFDELIEALSQFFTDEKGEIKKSLNNLIKFNYVQILKCPENGTTSDINQKDSGNETMDTNN